MGTTEKTMAASSTADEIGKLAYEGRLVILKNKLAENNSFSSRKDTSGRAPLHWAASGGHSDIVDHLLGLGVPVDDNDETAWTPLLIAASAGHLVIVERLLTAGAQV